MYELSIRGHFDAAHALHGYPGECRNLHGHTWDVEVVVRGTQLDEVGIVYDFKTLKTDLAAVLEPLDHGYLNDVPPFDTENPTAENLSRYIYERLSATVGSAVEVVEVSVWESPVARITYRPED
jgi:6-pyruvoyltetrahydropterin/6-carboxytetrahydropterin synthase